MGPEHDDRRPRAGAEPVWWGEVTEPGDLAALHGEVLAPAFPEAERGTAPDLVRGVKDGRRRVIGCRDHGGWVGAAVLHPYPPGWFLLEWLAVSPTQRGRGTGRALLDRACALAKDAGADFLLAEIEPPGTVPEHVAHGDPVRRARFYQAAHARMVAVTHYQPPAGPGQPFVPLLLIAIPVSEGSLPETLPADGVQDFLAAYHAGHNEDPVVRASLASVPEEEVVLVDLEDVFG